MSERFPPLTYEVDEPRHLLRRAILFGQEGRTAETLEPNVNAR